MVNIAHNVLKSCLRNLHSIENINQFKEIRLTNRRGIGSNLPTVSNWHQQHSPSTNKRKGHSFSSRPRIVQGQQKPCQILCTGIWNVDKDS